MTKKKMRTPEANPTPAQADTAEARLEGMEKALAKDGKRIVKLTDVTVTKELLTKAVVKSGKIPGNEVPQFVENILKDCILS